MSTDSSEQPVDPQTIEATRQQIRQLVNEIAALARSELTPGEFYAQFLDRVVAALAAKGGAMWVVNPNGQLELQHQINLRETGLVESQEDQRRHGLLLQKAMSTGEGALVPPYSGGGGDDDAANPTDFLLVLGPLVIDRVVQGVVEVFQRPGSRPNVQRGYLRFLMEMCMLAVDYLKSHRLRHFTDRQALWGQLEQFTREAHATLDPKLAAFTIVNEGRRLIGCDRVTVAIKRGRHCQVDAVSGQDVFDKRSTTIMLLGKLATAVVATGDDVWYTGDTTNMAPQVEEAVQAYVDESHTKTIGILPLFPPQPPSDERIDKPADAPRQPIGALIVEQIEDVRAREGMMQRVSVVRDHSATALGNSLEHHNLFLMPVWKTIGKSKVLVTARYLPKTLLAAGALLAVLIVLFLVPGTFELEGKGALQPVQRRDVYAGVDGTVVDVRVRQGQAIAKDTVLAVLRNNELEAQLADIRGKLAQALENHNAKESILLNQSADMKPEERQRLAGEIREVVAEVESLKAQLSPLLAKEKQLEVKSPGDGLVLTWDVHEELLYRPVQRGQALMSIGDPEQLWELQVRMPEDRMGHISRAEIERRKANKPLEVNYILATDPSTKLKGTVTEIHRMAEVKGEENTVMVRVAINKADIPDLRAGSTVTARVDCGRRSLGYVWFHDLVAWVQSKVLFRFF